MGWVLGAVVSLPVLVLLLWALADVLRIPVDVWAAAEESQLLWALVVLVPVAGPIIYLKETRPRLIEARSHRMR